MDNEKSVWINKETDETVAEKGGTYLVLNNSVKKDFLQTVSHKNVALKNFAISTGNIFVPQSISDKTDFWGSADLLKIKTPRLVFSSEFCKNLKNMNFVKHLWTTAPEC